MKTNFDKIAENSESLAEFICKKNFRCELKCSSCIYGKDPACGSFWDKNQCQEGIAEWLSQPLPMDEQFSDEDIKYAKHYYESGLRWIACSKSGIVEIFRDKPKRGDDDLRDGVWTRKYGAHQVISRNLFKHIRWEDEPISLDDIINSQK